MPGNPLIPVLTCPNCRAALKYHVTIETLTGAADCRRPRPHYLWESALFAGIRIGELGIIPRFRRAKFL